MLSKGFYTCENSNIIVEIVKISFRHPTKGYSKVKTRIYDNKLRVLERIRNYKLDHGRISHWKKVRVV